MFLRERLWNWDKKAGDPLLAGISWILVSSFLGFGLPVLTGRGSFILEPSEFIIMLDYSLFVPMLLGAYIFLIRSSGFFNAKHIQGSGHIPNIMLQKWFWAYQGALLIATIVVQYQAINSEIELPSPCSPWVTFAEKDWSSCLAMPTCQEWNCWSGPFVAWRALLRVAWNRYLHGARTRVHCSSNMVSVS